MRIARALLSVPLLSVSLLLVSAAPAANAATPADVQALIESRSPTALQAAETLAKAMPADVDAWIVLARARLQAGKAEAAIAAAEKATGLGPKNAQAFYWLGNAYGSRIGQVGMLSKMTMAPKLRDAFEQAVALDPALVDARSSLVLFYLQAPAAIGGGIDKARAQATAIAKYDRARGYLAQAQIASHEKKPEQMIGALESAVAAKPADEGMRVQLALGYQQEKRWADAHAAIRKWSSEHPASARPKYQLGRMAALSGQYLEEGEAALRAYLTMPRGKDDPSHAHVHYRLGQIQAKAGRKDDARASLQAALKLDPKLKEAKTALAEL
ncbi:MAG: tetratricopeptide repeat protein [Lysobacter sp.]|nr:tetratricopeptide repeat protein [Lysobacter sp.]